MPNFIRPNRPGASIFFTVTLAERGSDLLLREIDALRTAVKQTKRERPFHIDAWVVLPDHMHFVWALPDHDSDYSIRIGTIKSRFTRRVQEKPTLRTPSKIRKGDAGIWQRRFWEHPLRNEGDYAAHIRYCWINPVKHGLVIPPEEWPYSTVHRDKPKDLIL